MNRELKNIQYFKFCAYGLLRNLRFFEAFLLFFLIEKGLSFTQIGILYAVKEVFLNLFEIPSGIVADSYGRKYTLAGSFLVFSLSFVIFYFAGSFVFLLLAFAMVGTADAFRTGIHKAMMNHYLEINHWREYRTKYFANTRVWSQIGLALSSLIGGLVVFFTEGYEFVFLFTIVPYLLNFILLMSYPSAINFSRQKAFRKGGDPIKTTLKDFANSLRQKHIFGIMLNASAFTAFHRAVKDYLQPILVMALAMVPFLNQYEGERKNGMLLGMAYFFVFVFTSIASKRSGRVKNDKLTKAGMITYLIGLTSGVVAGILYEMNWLWMAAVLFIFIYLIENYRKPVVSSLVAEYVPQETLSTVLSAQSQLRTIISAILAVLMGIISDHFGIGVALIIVSILMSLIGMVPLGTLKIRKKVS